MNNKILLQRRDLGRGFSVKGLSPRLRELAALYGIAGLLPAAP